MKAIILHTACLDNGGLRHEPGVELVLGNDKGQIAAARARDLLAAGQCAEVAGKVSAPGVAPAPAAAD